MLLREYAIKRWFVIPPFLTNVSALSGETWTPKIVSFLSLCIQCLENNTAFLTCCRLRLLGRKSVHSNVASQVAERSRLRAEQCEEARHRSWTPAALSANVLLVADGVRSTTLLSQNWDALGCSSSSRGESGWQILPRGFAEEADAASRALHCRWHVRVSAGQRTGALCSRYSSAAAAGDTTVYLPRSVAS